VCVRVSGTERSTELNVECLRERGGITKGGGGGGRGRGGEGGGGRGGGGGGGRERESTRARYAWMQQYVTHKTAKLCHTFQFMGIRI